MTEPVEFPDDEAGLSDLLHDNMTDAEADAVLDETLARINVWRKAQGLPPLVWAEDGPDGDTG